MSSCYEATSKGEYDINGVPTYCDSEDGGGWHLAMQFNSKSNFKFDSPYWSDEKLLGKPGEENHRKSDGKYDAFNTIKIAAIRACWEKCVVIEVPVSHQKKTLHEIFKKVPIGPDGLEFSTTADEFGAALGIPNNKMCYQKVKINFKDNSQFKCKGRLALIRNNECNSVTANDALGFGVMEAFGGETGSGLTTAAPKQVTMMPGDLWVRPKSGNNFTCFLSIENIHVRAVYDPSA